MSKKTLQDIDAAQKAAKATWERQDRRQDRENAIRDLERFQLDMARNAFLDACKLTLPDKEAGEALVSLVKELQRLHFQSRLTPAAKEFPDHSREAYLAELLQEAAKNKANPLKLGATLNNVAQSWDVGPDGLYPQGLNLLKLIFPGFSVPEIELPKAPAESVADTLPATIPPNVARHSLDFKDVCWFGQRYLFTKTQAKCVELLWKDWEQGTPEVGGAALIKAADASADRTLPKIFRIKGNKQHPAWGTMIVPSKIIKGTYRLNDPNEPSAVVMAKPKRRNRKSPPKQPLKQPEKRK